VRIAVLDTGVEKSTRRNTPEFIQEHGSRIKGGKAFLGNEQAPWSKDLNGHGTHVTGLLLKVAPRTEIYVARILRGGEETIDPANVEEALKYCIDEWNIDIITMSFGFNKDQPNIKAQLKRAYDKDILVFSAASNDRASKPINIAWPARSPTVSCVFSANGEGGNSRFNPPARRGLNFCDIWGGKKEGGTSTKHRSGTSFATPIAAAIAALVLEFAR
ncbi:subtilisin-like protein, partial [Zopfia rhizophila CBS 207.26]